CPIPGSTRRSCSGVMFEGPEGSGKKVEEDISQDAQGAAGNMEELFKSTSDFVTHWEAGKKAPPDVLAKVYGLFKQATVGDACGDPPADESKKAKFEAWLANKGMSKDEAMAAYVKLIDEKKAIYNVTARLRSEAEYGGA
ncbi:unnamed protein product, partial [Polarella glacialis]